MFLRRLYFIIPDETRAVNVVADLEAAGVDRQHIHAIAGKGAPAALLTAVIQGVFASRFPYRPNGIGLSLVRVLGIAHDVITVGGADLLDGTPVLDIKPWFADCDDPRALPG